MQRSTREGGPSLCRALSPCAWPQVRFLSGAQAGLTAHAVASALDGSMTFSSVSEVEIVARVGRRVLDMQKKGRAMAEAHAKEYGQLVMAAEAVLLLGLHQFKTSSMMHIMRVRRPVLPHFARGSPRRPSSRVASPTNPRYGCFLLEVMHDHARGYALLDQARSLNPSMRERFMIFVRERERTQKASSDSMGGGSMDLARGPPAAAGPAALVIPAAVSLHEAD